MLLLSSNGFRTVARDRRGHGRSSQPWDGNDMDTYADDLATVSLHGISVDMVRAALPKVILVSSVPPLMLKTAANPGSLPIEAFDQSRAAQLANRSQFYKDLPAGPFYGFNRPGAKVLQGLIDAWWMQGMQGGHKNTYDSIKAFSETDSTEDLKKLMCPL